MALPDLARAPAGRLRRAKLRTSSPQRGGTALGDFTIDARVLADRHGGGGGHDRGWFGFALVKLIALVTNLAYFGQFSTFRCPSPARRWAAGGARAGGRRPDHRPDGALRLGEDSRPRHSRGDRGDPASAAAASTPKVAVLKPLSSAISIGTGGPFGAEGPIIMTGGAFGSLFAQLLPSERRRAQDAAGRRRRGRHDRHLRHADRGGAAGGRAAAVRMEAAQLHPGGGRGDQSPRPGAPLLLGGRADLSLRRRSRHSRWSAGSGWRRRRPAGRAWCPAC